MSNDARGPVWPRGTCTTHGSSAVARHTTVSRPSIDPLLIVGAAALVTNPLNMLAGLGRIGRRVVAAVLSFLEWGLIAWLVFAVSSRLALAGG
jgi:hypothetical protein